jgi:hypothetical protein
MARFIACMALAICTAAPAQAPTKAPDACSILLANGGREFLGGSPERISRDLGRTCQLTNPASGVVSFTLRPGVGRATFDRDVEKMRRDPNYSFKEEPEFGATAFSSSVGSTGATIFVVLKGDLIVVLQIQSLHSDPGAVRTLVRRVLAGV